MTLEKYLNALKERRLQLKGEIMVSRHDNTFVKPSDKRHTERRLITRILKLHGK